MRSRSTLGRTGLLIIGLAALTLFGCSDDSSGVVDGTQSDPLNLADLNPAVAAQLDSAITLFASGLDIATLRDGGHLEDDLSDVLFTAGPPDSSSQVDGWLVYFYTDLQTGTGTTLTVITDSIQFRAAGVAVDGPRFADALTYRHKYQLANNQISGEYNDYAIRGDLVYTNIDDDAATINGLINVMSRSQTTVNDVSYWNNWVIDAEVTGIAIGKTSGAWAVGCPESGSVNLVVTHTYQPVGGVEQVEEWDVAVTFTDGSYTATVAQGEEETSYTEQACTF